MTYENAPSTRLVATNCACCARPLRDAYSVECGVGPDCREKYGFNVVVDDEKRALANQSIHRLAVLGAHAQKSPPMLTEMTERLEALRIMGFTALVEKIADRLADVTIKRTPTGDVIVTWAFLSGKHGDVVAAAKQAGAKFLPDDKAWRFAKASEKAVLKILKLFFAGHVAIGPKGVFVIGA